MRVEREVLNNMDVDELRALAVKQEDVICELHELCASQNVMIENFLSSMDHIMNQSHMSLRLANTERRLADFIVYVTEKNGEEPVCTSQEL